VTQSTTTSHFGRPEASSPPHFPSLATGHAAGVAAALHAAAANPVAPQQVQEELQRQDARLAGS